MDSATAFLDIFERNGVKPTAIRLLVFRTMKGFDRAFSLQDMEDELPTVDKSTLFRTLTLFHEHHFIHSVEDGSGSLKYCVCQNNGACTVEELHCHFYCEACQRTFCLDESPVPVAEIPDGFHVHEVTYLLKGLCPECAKNHKH